MIYKLKVLFQVVLFIFSIFLIAEGLWGDQLAPKNLTTLFTWVHYRGFLVLFLLLWGNFFCLSCPFIFFRNLLRIFIAPRWTYPVFLQHKWLGLILFIVILFCYEYFSWWSSPKITALIILTYFLTATIIDLLFKKASFCKYICPVGQFNFISSLLSPKTVGVVNLEVCKSCETHDCLSACETGLLLPKKSGNMDCTFCMNCSTPATSGCKYNNVTLQSNSVYINNIASNVSYGVRDLDKRLDIQVFLWIFFFGGWLNAFLMTPKAQELKHFARVTFNIQNEFLLLFLIFLFFLFIIPRSLYKILNLKNSPRVIFYVTPLAFSLWLAHYLFHLLTGLLTFIPLITYKSIPVSWMGLSPAIVTPLQTGIVLLGFSASVIIYLKSEREALIQKALVLSFLVLLFLCSLWIMIQPMDMRGTFVS